MSSFGSRCLFFILITAVILTSSACGTNKTFSSNEQPRPLSKNEIAKRAESTLRNADYIEITARIHQELLDGYTRVDGGTEPVVLKSIMAKDKLRTFVYMNGEMFRGFSVYDGRYQEYEPKGNMRPIFEYDSPYTFGTNRTVVRSEQSCLIAGGIISWAGVTEVKEGSLDRFGEPADTSVDTAAVIRHMIEAGVQEPDANERGHECYVFKYSFPVDGGKIEHKRYVDKKTFLVVRWDTKIPGSVRIRLQDIKISSEIPPGTEWKIKAGVDPYAGENLK